MENKTQVAFVIIAFIAVVIGLAFWPTIGDSVGTLARIQTSTNASFTFPENGTSIDLVSCGQLNTSAIVVFNETNGTAGFQNFIVPANNYTVTQGISPVDGYLVTRLAYNGGGVDRFGGFANNVTCTYQPRGYITDGGGRAIALIIPILAALAIAFSAFPDLRQLAKEKLFG